MRRFHVVIRLCDTWLTIKEVIELDVEKLHEAVMTGRYVRTDEFTLELTTEQAEKQEQRLRDIARGILDTRTTEQEDGTWGVTESCFPSYDPEDIFTIGCWRHICAVINQHSLGMGTHFMSG